MKAKTPQPRQSKKAPSQSANADQPANLDDPASLRAMLDGEIVRLCSAARQMFEKACNIEDPLDAIKAFSAYGSQVTRLPGLLRARISLVDHSDETGQMIQQALREIAKELWK
jgi:hypothetical protein